MKRLLAIAALLSLTVPAALAAPPAGKGPGHGHGKGQAQVVVSSNETNPAKACKAERGTTAQSSAAFDQEHGTNPNKRNEFGKCVSSKTKVKNKSKADEDDDEAEAEDQDDATTAAAKKCKTERGTTAQSSAAFDQKHGTNPNKRNAFGKCVSKNAKPAQQ